MKPLQRPHDGVPLSAMADPADMEHGEERYGSPSFNLLSLSSDASRSRNCASLTLVYLFANCLFAARVRLFSLEIKVEGFCTTDSNGRKAYTKGSVIKWDVEVGSFTFELLMQSLTNQFKWSPT